MLRFFLTAGLLCGLTIDAVADSDAFIGDVITAGYTFCPEGTLQANGQLLAIDQYESLFSLIGTKYGGDGRNTFALPKLNPAYTASAGRPVLIQCIATDGVYPSRP